MCGRRKCKFIIIILFLFSLSYNLLGQNDCVMYPIENYVDTSENIFICKVDSLMYDSLYGQLKYVMSHRKSNIAKVSLIQVFKSKEDQLRARDIVVVESPNYMFDMDQKYLLFCKKDYHGVYQVYYCAYNADVKNTKYFNKLYKKIYRRLIKINYDKLVNTL